MKPRRRRTKRPISTRTVLEFSLGTRREPNFRTDDRFWSGVDGEVFLMRSWFGLVNFTKEWGRDHLTPTTELLYASLSNRF